VSAVLLRPAILIGLSFGIHSARAFAEPAAPPASDAQRPETAAFDRGAARFRISAQPFAAYIAPAGPDGFGLIGGAALEYHFRAPVAIGVELSPLLFTSQSQSEKPRFLQAYARTLVANTRARIAYDGPRFGIGVAAGLWWERLDDGRFQAAELGPDSFVKVSTDNERQGPSVALALRLGGTAGAHGSVEVSTEAVREVAAPQNQLVVATRVAVGLRGDVAVPINERLAIAASAALVWNTWGMGTIGVRYLLTRARSARATAFLTVAPGWAATLVRATCVVVAEAYQGTYNPPAASCPSGWRTGPGVSLALDTWF
jgi:hypothetical protein